MRRLLVPGLLLSQTAVVWFIAGAERPPAPPDLAGFPAVLGEWSAIGEDPAAAQVREISKADRLLSRYYLDRTGETAAHFLVAWYRSQRDGIRQPHQPKMCLLGSGWLPVAESDMRIVTAAGTVTARRYLVARRRERAAVLYWYQTPRRALAGEWETKFWLGLDALRARRSDAALVRITIPAPPGCEEAVFTRAAALARLGYPALRRWWPR
jgi:EpsI family protein